MRLAQTIVIRIGSRSLELRPTLRAALALERAHGLDRLGEKVLELGLTAITDMIAETATTPATANDIAGLMLPGGLTVEAMRLTPDLLELLEGLCGIDPDAEETTEKAEEPLLIADVLRSLYRMGTGKIGWTPAETFDATPLEILEAWRGRCELLREVFGGADKAPAKAASLDDKFAALIARNATLPGAQAA